MRIQQGSSARATNAIRVYDGTPEAILLLIAGDLGAHRGLTKVFAIHEAPLIDLEHELPELDEPVGDCAIGSDGVLVTMEGTGRYLMGVRLSTSWGRTEPSWSEAAMRTGRVWVGLLPHATYEQGPTFKEAGIPELPVLRLDAVSRTELGDPGAAEQ